MAVAQEIYFSISGGTVGVDSGDRTGEYDYWFRPVPGTEEPRPVTVEIFDAGLGGFADVVMGTPNTSTSFSLFAFSDLYELHERSLEKRPASLAGSLDQVTAFTESRFLNRWVPFFELAGSTEEGYIMRVNTNDGNDVNDFRIRVTGPGAEDWQLITLNLSVGLIGSGPENRFQFRPLWQDVPPPLFDLAGHEDTRVFLADAFGDRREIADGWDDYQPVRYGKDNYWGVVMTGSQIRINNRVLKGRDEIVPFYFDPLILGDEGPGLPDVVQMSGESCKSYGMEVRFRGFSLDTDRAEWLIDGQMFTGRSFIHEFSGFGSHPYRVIFPTRGLHVPGYVVQEGEVLVNTPPVANVSGYQAVLSPGERIVLDASSSYDPEGRRLQYQWFLNDDFRSSDDRFVFSSSVSGKYAIRLVLSDNEPGASCTETVEEFSIVVNTEPYAEIGFKPVIAKNVAEAVYAINAFDADGDELYFSWSGEGTRGVQTGEEAQILHETAGIFDITLTANDQTGTRNSAYTTRVQYKVNAAPIPVFSLPGIVAPGEAFALDASNSSDSDGDALTFTWNISDGRTLGGENNTLAFDEPGLYTITLTADDGENVENSVRQLTQEIRVNEAPVPVITAVSHTHNSIVSFDANESYDQDQHIVSYQWDFGDGNTAEGARVTHTYSSQGAYTVILTVDDGTGVSNSIQSAAHDIVINKSPVAEISAPGLVAPGESFVLDGSGSYDPDGSVVSFSWHRNGRLLGEGETLAISLDEPGIHYIDLVIRDDAPFEESQGVTSTAVRVNYPPVVNLQISPAVTEPERPTVFDASESYDPDNRNDELTYRWVFSDGTEFAGDKIEHTFSMPGTYYFTLYVDDGEGLANSVTVSEGSIRVNNPPIIVTQPVIRSNNFGVVLDASESYDPDGSTINFTWILPDGTERNEASFTWTAPERGVHAISLIVDDGEGLGNSREDQRIEVMINHPPVAVADDQISSCTDQVIIFSSARSFDPDGDSFTTAWEFGDGNVSAESNPVHSYSMPGFYTARLILDDGFTENLTIQEIPVFIEGSPQARILEEEVTVCANTPVTFDGSGSTDPNGMIGSFSWDFGDLNSAVGEKTTHLFTRPGTYRVTLTITGSGSGNCSNISQATAIVHVIAAPRADFDLPSVMSPGQAITLDASKSETNDPITRAQWEIKRNGETVEVLEGMEQAYQPELPGRYEVALTVFTDNEAGCGTNTRARAVQVNEAPKIVWNLPEVWPQHLPFMLSADGTTDPDGFIERYIWYMNGEEIGRGLTTELPVKDIGDKQIELLVRDNSGVENSEVRKTGTVYLNPAPEPHFTLLQTVYKGERVELVPRSNRDISGNSLTSVWQLNGEIITNPHFIATEPVYEIVLIQDDSLGLPNSRAALKKILNVIQPPHIELQLNAFIIEGHSLSGDDFQLPETVAILQNGEPAESWQADEPGTQQIQLGWIPAGEVLETYNFDIEVLPRLQALIPELRYSAVHNPLNNTVRVQTPGVNRDINHVMSYTWVAAGRDEILFSGSVAELSVTEGLNRFELIIRENPEVVGREELRVPVVIEVRQAAEE